MFGLLQRVRPAPGGDPGARRVGHRGGRTAALRRPRRHARDGAPHGAVRVRFGRRGDVRRLENERPAGRDEAGARRRSATTRRCAGSGSSSSEFNEADDGSRADRERVPAGRRPQARLTARLLIEYDGSRFAGWARQHGQRTVQAAMEEVLATVPRRAGRAHGRGPDGRRRARPRPGGEPRRRAAGARRVERRTCRGTCACSRASPRPTASTPAGTRPRAPTRYRLLHARPASAVRARPRAPLAASARPRGARRLRRAPSRQARPHGLHAAPRRSTSASSATSPRPSGSTPAEHVFEFRIEAPSFMRNQVRILVGTMLDVGRGRCARRGLRARCSRGGRAPRRGDRAGHGLYLVRALRGYRT